MKKLLLSLLLAGAVTAALAQGVAQNTVTGNECWNAGQGPGGPSNFLCINLVRGTLGTTILSSASGTVTGSTSAMALLVNAQPANNTTINTPPSPVSDGFNWQVCNVTNTAWVTNTVTLAASSGQSLNTGTVTALTTLAAHSCVELIYQLSNTTWYQIR